MRNFLLSLWPRILEYGMIRREEGLGMELEYVKFFVDFQSQSGIRGGLRTLFMTDVQIAASCRRAVPILRTCVVQYIAIQIATSYSSLGNLILLFALVSHSIT